MGQRTQILLQTVDRKGLAKTKVYHEQWGFSRTMPSMLMAFIVNLSYGSKRYAPYNGSIHDIGFDSYDVTDEVPYINQLNLNNIEQVKEILNCCDNNNGYMIVQLAEEGEKYSYDLKLTVKFMRGLEECPDSLYTRYSKKKLQEWEFKYVSFDKYCKPFTYCDKKFKKLFKDFCSYYEVDLDLNTKFIEPNLQLNIEQEQLNNSKVIVETAKSIV